LEPVIGLIVAKDATVTFDNISERMNYNAATMLWAEISARKD
jgi:hypothetical protein